MQYLTDYNVVKNCETLKPANLPKFLTPKSKNNLRRFLESCTPQKGFPSHEIEGFQDLWKQLLSDAITYLKQRDKREYQRGGYSRDKIAFGVDKLCGYFREYHEFEALLYADRFYRDHVMHVFRVWLVGIWLMEKYDNRIYWDLKPLNGGNKEMRISPNELSAMWCIIALTHDLGYPLDKIDRIRKKIEAMMSYFGGASSLERGFEIPTHHHFINDFILKFISSKLALARRDQCETQDLCYKTELQSKYYLKFSKSFENFDHGIISCIVLMKNLVYFLESDFDLSKPFTDSEDARQFYIRREMLRSIASHTCPDIYHLYPNTLSFILILADELQQWGRPTLAELKGLPQLELRVKVPTISLNSIKIELELDMQKAHSADKEDHKKLFFELSRTWYKRLRSALDSKKRNFDFLLSASVKLTSGAVTTYRFENGPGNKVGLTINGKKQVLTKTLYQ